MNEITRQYEDKNIIIYKRVNRPHKGIKLYFVESEGKYSGTEFTNIFQVKAFIKNLI